MFVSEANSFASYRKREIAVAKTIELFKAMHHAGVSRKCDDFQGRQGSIDRLRLLYQNGLVLIFVKQFFLSCQSPLGGRRFAFLKA